jgi:uncharacterized protein YjiK
MNVKRNQLDSEPRFVISLNELNKKFGIKDFFPSAIERSVDGNSFFILSSKGEPCLIEISNKGKILNAKKLPKKVHRQPEGLAIFNDDKIIIADEAAGKMPTLTIYHKNPLRKE